MRGPTQKLGLIGSTSLTFLRYKHQDRQAKYIYIYIYEKHTISLNCRLPFPRFYGSYFLVFVKNDHKPLSDSWFHLLTMVCAKRL